jgi:hypothetical protein
MFPLPLISTSPYCNPVTLEQGEIVISDGKECCLLDNDNRSIVFFTVLEPYGCYAFRFWICAIDNIKRFKIEITDGMAQTITPYSVNPSDECMKVLFFTARSTPNHLITIRITDILGGQLKVERIYFEKMITAIGPECLIKVRTIEGGEELNIMARDVEPGIHQVYHPSLDVYDDIVEKRLVRPGEIAGKYVKICHLVDSNSYNFIVKQNYPIIVDGMPSHVHTVESWNEFQTPV